MAKLQAIGAGGMPDSVLLSTAQTGNGNSTDTLDRLGGLEACLLEITTTVGATPTVTVDVQGTADDVGWWNVPYADIATPSTWAVAALVITTAGTRRLILPANIPWRGLRLVYSANTNVTTTAKVTVF
jgi:hypothetical protein